MSDIRIFVMNPTPDAERVCAVAARQCMVAKKAEDLYRTMTEDEITATLTHCMKAGHLAVLSAAHVSVAANVTREALTQINTSAWVKTVTQSQQYVDHFDFAYLIPEEIKDDPEAVERFKQAMERDKEDYRWFRRRGYAPQVARAVLSNAVEANTVMSSNFWGWFVWLSRRVCRRNTTVTQKVAEMILNEFRSRWPRIFKWCGPPCIYGQCREVKPCGNPFSRIVE